MCTFNGAQYIREQLDSIALQTRPPDELIVCDDCSTDSTMEIVKNFAAGAGFSVRFSRNEKKLGSTKNFEKAIGLCTGATIALSDQDDVWQPEKLRLIEAVLVNSPTTGAVFTDAEVVDACLGPLGYRLWEAKNFSSSAQKKVTQGKAVEVLLRRNVVTGATMAFREKFRRLILPIPEGWVHDAWIALLVAAQADLAFIGQALIKYRQHDRQQLGARKNSFMEQLSVSRRTDANNYVHQLNNFTAAHERLLSGSTGHYNRDAIALLEAKIGHLKVRGNMTGSKLRRLPTVIKELCTLRYHRFSYGWKSAIKDLLGETFMKNSGLPFSVRAQNCEAFKIEKE
jgi:glycosyltransferase involved in cell wall biosynthesis